MSAPVIPSDPEALGELSRQRVKLKDLRLRRLLAVICLVAFAVTLLWAAVSSIFAALQAQQIDPKGQVNALAVIIGVGAIGAMVAAPIAGVVTDRARSRIGGRALWMLISAVVTVVFAVLMATATTIPELVVYFFLVQVSTNFLFTPMTAFIPVRVPLAKRGLFSGLLTLTGLIGTILGQTFGAIFSESIFVGYVVVGVLVLACTVVFVAVVRESDADATKHPVRLLDIVQAFWVNPVKHPSFAWTFAGRMALFTGYYLVTVFNLYILQNYVHLGRDAVNAVPILGFASLAGILVATPIGSALVDRVGHTKTIVNVSAVVMGIGMLVPFFSPTLGAMLASAVVAGIGFGAYNSVDFVLVTQVLPSMSEAGKDLGIMNINSTLPQTIGVAISGGIVSLFGGYVALFPVAAVLCVLAAVLLAPVRLGRNVTV